MKSVIAAAGVSVVAAEVGYYCPSADDMNLEHGDVEFKDGGWAYTGDARVSSKTSWNLLGGYMEFDMDTTQTLAGVNTNFYTSSPAKVNCGEACYCDIQDSKNASRPSCMEMDIIEANGNCAMATTVHTFATDGKPNNPDCDRWGCQSSQKLSGKKFHIQAQFATDGSMTVLVDNIPNSQWNTNPSDASNQKVVTTMTTLGAVIESSQWFGWAPEGDACPKGNATTLPQSKFTISNVRVAGTVVQGPEPTKCGGPAPAPTPPAPVPPPPPPTHCCSWDDAHKVCGNTTDYCKSAQRACEDDCGGKWIPVPTSTIVV